MITHLVDEEPGHEERAQSAQADRQRRVHRGIDLRGGDRDLYWLRLANSYAILKPKVVKRGIDLSEWETRLQLN